MFDDELLVFSKIIEYSPVVPSAIDDMILIVIFSRLPIN